MRLPIFFYHNSAQSFPRMGFGVFVTPPAYAPFIVTNIFGVDWVRSLDGIKGDPVERYSE
jgi:hypothetical protein